MAFRDKFLFSAILLFITSLLFPQFQPFSIATAAMVIIAGLIYNPFKEKLQLLQQRSYLWGMLAFMVLLFISAGLSENTNRAFRYLDPRLPLLYFPFSIGLIQITKELRNRILLGIALVITLVALLCVGNGLYYSYTLHNTALLYNDALSGPITKQQSIYLSLLVNIAIYIFAWFALYHRDFRYKGWLVVAIVFLFGASFLFASRNLMLVLYGSCIVFGLYYSFSRKKYLEGATLIMGLFIAVFMVYKFSPKTINRFKELAYTQFDYQKDGMESHYNMAIDSSQWNGANTRIAIWRCGWEMFLKHPVMGVGLGDKKDQLMEVYRQKNFQFALRTGKNLHNNYLDILVSTGIIGLSIFLLAWIILPFRTMWKNKDGLAFVIFFTFAAAMVTEIYFDRSLGGMLFGFFVPFLLSSQRLKRSVS